ncbi:enoyl-CoA hydratase-related protein [Rhodopseudomonas pseudopalustris]|uniref:Enoyl-CoA hydratase/carnithine racemase n=1 Tax=Rhodopseudomonas pseudopalustris TaxID=1513892 RepID=A0A1H8M8Y1_9BRAD|nr:enoyl-CoA hydratase-related protein [Rhodopseudomonas pseudopalustris]SEO13606.1 Enoyl-CoA hydratase/carnithine racemase [Rhodopseudomonas pseudopalustris]
MFVDRDLSVERRESVAVMRLSRPERMNAMTPDMEAALRDAVEAANADPSVRVIVITGAGKAFCAGADLRAVKEGNYYEKQADLLRRADSTAAPYIGRFSYFSLSPKPIVAALNGAAVGVGITLALSCDLRVARSGAKLALSFSRLGLAAEEGVALLLPRLIGASAAMDLLLTGRTLTAEHGHNIGLITSIYDDDDFESAVLSNLQEMTTVCSPDAMRRIKSQVWDSVLCGYDEAVKRARIHIEESRQGNDFQEAVASFAEKRVPQYAGLSLSRDKQLV